MQSAIQTSNKNYRPKNSFSTPVNSGSCFNSQYRPAQEFENIFLYHNKIIRQIVAIKAAAEAHNTGGPGYQEEFIFTVMRGIAEYSLLFINSVRRIQTSGLKNYGKMLLSGASILLGGNENGNFFKSAIGITLKNYTTSNIALKPFPYSAVERDHGIYIGFIQELLKELKSFSYNHPLYQQIATQLELAD